MTLAPPPFLVLLTLAPSTVSNQRQCVTSTVCYFGEKFVFASRHLGFWRPAAGPSGKAPAALGLDGDVMTSSWYLSHACLPPSVLVDRAASVLQGALVPSGLTTDRPCTLCGCQGLSPTPTPQYLLLFPWELLEPSPSPLTGLPLCNAPGAPLLR